MDDLLQLSADIVDNARPAPVSELNPVDGTLHRIADDVALVTGFSHVIAIRSHDEFVVFDTSLPAFAANSVRRIDEWEPERRLAAIVYTHGHVDHVGGARLFLDLAERRGGGRPEVVSHTALPARFRRYDLTSSWNGIINRRQFGGALMTQSERAEFFSDWVEPTRTFFSTTELWFGETKVVLQHDKGETDDHAWAWIESLRAVCSGDFFCWVFPNAGNPQKVQRYPLEWAQALRKMAALQPELLLPAHGLPLAGAARIATVLEDAAGALEHLVAETLERMNAGWSLHRVLGDVRLPQDLAERPWLQPVYDEPEFVVRNVWRAYGGWYDGNPANLKPAPLHALARELARACRGARALSGRARELLEEGRLRAAAELVELAAAADPDDKEIHALRADIYERLRSEATSLMAKGIYSAAAAESRAKLGGEDEPE